MQPPWKDKLTHAAQLGGIETSVLDNGPGRGTRIAWINTGTGLRYKVVLDRAMDIADAFYGSHSLAWLSHSGVTAPQPFSHQGLGWLKTFGGGLLTTCGLTHVGGPEEDDYGQRGLHGEISNTTAEVTAVRQPDPANDHREMSISGRMRQTRVFGPSLELKRTISGSLGKAVISIKDEVTNLGNTPVPHMLLYHCNLGWPLVDEGASIVWDGEWQAAAEQPVIFRKENNFRQCPAPMDKHRGAGEEVAFIDASADPEGYCRCGIHNAQLGLALSIRFRKNQLPWLTNWQHWGRGEYVTGLEPGTHPPIGQAQARQRDTLIFLEPGESRSYELEFEVLSTDTDLANFLSNHNEA